MQFMIRQPVLKTMRWPLAAGFLAAAWGASWPLPAQDEKEDREERLKKTIEAALVMSDSGSPSVLGGIDPLRADAATRRIARVLRGTKLDIELEKQPVGDVLDLFRKVAGINFVISQKARESLEAEKVQVTFTLKGLPLENVLNLLAIQLGKYRFVVRYGAVMLIREEEYRPARILRVYDVSDVVRPPPDFPAPKLALDSEKER